MSRGQFFLGKCPADIYRGTKFPATPDICAPCTCARHCGLDLGQSAHMCVCVRRPVDLYTALHLCKPKSHNGLDFRSAMPPADRVCVRSSLSWSCIHGASKSWRRRERGLWWVMMFPSFGIHS